MKRIIPFTILLLTIIPAAASAAELLVTWKSNAFAPSNYRGKILPGLGSMVTLSANLIDNNKVVSLASRDIRWFLNGKLFDSGIGKTTVQFERDPLSLTDAAAQIKIFLNYNGGNIERFVTIPFAKPEVVIHADAPDGIIVSGSHTLRALLYHWNITDTRDVTFGWNVNGEPAGSEGDLSNVNLDIPRVSAPSPLNLTLSARNPKNEFEFTNTSLALTIK